MSKLSCSDFAKHALGVELWPRQRKILDDLFEKDIRHAIWAMGRRSSKTFMAAIAATYMCFVEDEYFIRRVRKGEKWYVITVANDLGQSKIALDNIRQLIVNSPFNSEIIRETSLEVEISNGCVFQAIPASARASRGKAVVGILQDELSFALEGDANRGAKAMYDALSPSIAQFGKHGKILELSSPWLDSGLFYEHFRQAQSGEFPTMQALQIPTWEINPALPWGCDFLENARKKDEETFWVEFGAQFRKNNSAFLQPEIIDASINKNRGILTPRADYRGTYVLSLDPARGGANRDEYVACIVHFEGQTLVVDEFYAFEADFEIGGKKEVNIARVEEWIKEKHRVFDFQSIVLDQFNSSATIQTLQRDFPISELTWSVSTKMKAFSKMRELFSAGLVEMYPHKQAIWQLKNLSVIFRSSGQWTVTGGKETAVDDYAFCLAGAVLEATRDSDVDWLNSLIR